MADLSKDLSRNSLSFGTFDIYRNAIGEATGQFPDHPCRKCWVKFKSAAGECQVSESSPAAQTDFGLKNNSAQPCEFDVDNTNKLYYRIAAFTPQTIYVIYIE